MSTNSGYRKKFGTWGENQGLHFLLKKGYLLRVKNYHTRFGEIDLIMSSGDYLVAVEVKTRKSKAYGIAEYSITRKKFQSLQAAMLVYLESLDQPASDWQVDVLVIETNLSGNPDIIHYENVYLDYLNE
jgi:putative endonuclease